MQNTRGKKSPVRIFSEFAASFQLFIASPNSTKGVIHRRRINSEEIAKVIAAARWTELIKFLAGLATVFCTRMIERDKFILFFKSSWCN